MDVHPIIVHFPVALLTVYAVLELVRFNKVVNQPYWFQVKGTFLFLGTLGAFAALMTGPGGNGGALKEMHQTFAGLTTLTFSLITLSYLGEWFKPSKYSHFMMKPYIIIPLALIGLGCITITGGLGGALVYGTDFDPFMAPIFKLLGVY